ncbi:MAG: DUF2007 domain-containing protein [Prevotellaceae bacterium]|jgi:hypothetical protein|nr:DUF2007 domain-containing protein [Prevotellaceae bacterium]
MTKKEENMDLIEVYRGSEWEAELVKGLLESNGIAAMIGNGEVAAIYPHLMNDQRVLVMEKDEAAALDIINNREKK